jgi:hypothetical protein
MFSAQRGFTSGVGVSVFRKGDIRLITDAFVYFPPRY